MSEKETFPTRFQSSIHHAGKRHAARDLALCSTSDARQALSYQDALSWKVLPLSILEYRGHRLLTVAGEVPPASEKERALKFLTGCSLNSVATEEENLVEAIFIAYRGEVQELTGLVAKLPEEKQTIGEEFSVASSDAAQPVPTFLYRLIEYGVSKRASDICLYPEGGGTYSCTIRIDGALSPLPIPSWSTKAHHQLLNRVRVLAELQVEALSAPADGSFSFPLPSGSAQVRFHIFPTLHGPKINFRLPVTTVVPALSELGFSAKTRTFLEAVLDRSEGAVILSGPTGSGKTTTCYSALSFLTKQQLSIVSLEDPVEAPLAGVLQTDLASAKGLCYSDGIKHVLRQDPDVIFIGEVRDRDSAVSALEAAATGHLVLSAVHGARAFEALNRLARLSGDRELVADGLSLVLSQRLLPRLCGACKVIDLCGTKRAKGTVYQAAGCPACQHTGYRGRVLIDESLYMTSEMRERLRVGRLREADIAGKRYFQGLEESLRSAILDGVIDLKNAKKIVRFQ